MVVSKPKPPATILLRSRERVAAPEGKMLLVDLHRHDRLLGWGDYPTELFHRIVDIPGHHYNVFADNHLKNITQEIKSACNTLTALYDSPSQARAS